MVVYVAASLGHIEQYLIKTQIHSVHIMCCSCLIDFSNFLAHPWLMVIMVHCNSVRSGDLRSQMQSIG